MPLALSGAVRRLVSDTPHPLLCFFHCSAGGTVLRLCSGPVYIPSTLLSSQELDKPVESEDVESNLLKPAAMPVCMATFQLRIYRAEDIPQSMCHIAQGIPLHGLGVRAGGWEPGLQGLFLGRFSSLGRVWAL